MRWLFVLGLVYPLMLTIVYGVGQLNLSFMTLFSNVLFPVTAAAASTASFLTLKRYSWHNPKPLFSVAWISFTAGITLWFLGELTWAIYILYLVAQPFPSLADIFYFTGYIFLFLALSLIIKLFKQSFSRKIEAITVAVTIALTAVVSYLLLIPIYTSSEGLVATVLAVSYPILDLGLFVLALPMLLVFLEGTVGKAWFFITLGVVLNTVADLFFSYAELQGFFYEGHPFELFWLWGYVAFLLGFFIHWREL